MTNPLRWLKVRIARWRDCWPTHEGFSAPYRRW